jgi:predicted methyltransferase
MWIRAPLALSLIAVASCRVAPQPNAFPDAGRDVAPIVGESFSTEDARDRIGEAEEVVRLAAVAPAMSVADIGAGEGYYTVRLSPIVGRRGRVLAEDIVPETRDRLAQRVQRERLDNVAVKLGAPADPMLPPTSFDRIFLVHMYHEVTALRIPVEPSAGPEAGRAGRRRRFRSAGEATRMPPGN